jgi:hypothetical protein
MAIGDPHRFFNIAQAYSSGGGGVTPTNIWWQFGHLGGIAAGPHGTMRAFTLPGSLSQIAHPLVVALALAGAGLFWWRRPHAGIDSIAGLMALILLLRPMLDPLSYGYHFTAALIAMAVFETLRRRTLPYGALVLAAMAWLMQHVVAPADDLDLAHRVFLAWSLPLAGYLAAALFFPSIRQRLTAMVRPAEPVHA